MAKLNISSMGKAFDGAMGLVAFFKSIPKSCKDDVVDGVLDFIEAKATVKESYFTLTICNIVRQVVNVPDEEDETDQTQPK